MPTEITRMARHLTVGDRIRIHGEVRVVTYPSLDWPSDPGKVIVHVDGEMFKADADHQFDVYEDAVGRPDGNA